MWTSQRDRPKRIGIVKMHRPCPVCRERLVRIDASRCFSCAPRDPIFDLLDSLIAQGVTTPRSLMGERGDLVLDFTTQQ